MFHCGMIYEGALGGLMPVHDAYMRSSVPGVYVCGDLAGVEEASTALDEGRLAGLNAAFSLGFGGKQERERFSSFRESLDKLRNGKHGLVRRQCKERICRQGGILLAAAGETLK